MRGRSAALEIQAIERVDALLVPVRRLVVLHDHHRDVVGLHRVRQRDQRALGGVDLGGHVVVDPVADVLHAGIDEVFGGVVGLGQAGSEPAHRALAGELLELVHGAVDHAGLVLLLVDRTLLPAVAHELPAGVLAGGGDARVVDRHARVDRQRRADAEALVQRVEAPEADAHAVLVPRPVGHVGQHGLARGRRQHLPRHRLGDVPDLEVDDGPDDDAVVARQLHHRTVDDGAERRALARNHGHG